MIKNLTRSRKAKGCLFIMTSLFILCCACTFVGVWLAEPVVAPFRQVMKSFNAGISHYEQKEYEQALDEFEQTFIALQEIEADLPLLPSTYAQLQQVEGFLLGMMGTIYYQQGQYKQAVKTYEESIIIFRETDVDEQLLALILILMGGDPPEGYENRPLEALENRLLNNLGVVYLDMGEYEQALNAFEKVLTTHRKVGSKASEGVSLINIGNVYYQRGQYQQALQTYFDALAIHKEVGNRQEEAIALGSIGLTHATLGQYDSAQDYLQQVLVVADEINEPSLKGPTFSNMGVIYLSLRKYDDALESFLQALPILQQSNDRSAEGGTFSNIGDVYIAMGQYELALDYYQEALVISKDVGTQAREGAALTGIGLVHQNLGQFEEALDSYQQALIITQKIEDRPAQMVTLNNIGEVYAQQGDITKAITFYQQAVDLIESIQNDLKVEEFKASFAGEMVVVYEDLVDLLWAEGRFEEAFNYVERARARAFLDQFANGVVDYRAGSEAALLEREQILRGQVTTNRAQLFALLNRPANEWDKEAIAMTEAELEEAEQKYSRFLGELKVQSPEAASLVGVDVASLAEIQSLLDAETALVEYFVLEERTLAFVITKDSKQSVTLDVSREKLAETINNFRTLDFAVLGDAHSANLQQLHTWLITPLQAHLTTSKLVIVPHRVLHYLPFTALTNGERYLSDDYALSVLPSANVLRFLPEKRKPNADTILALGNPTIETPLLQSLSYAAQEAETVAALYGKEAKVGASATESMVWSQAGQNGILHLAAHGQYNSHNPLFSTIHLASDEQNDGRLEVHEIYGLDLTQATDLVVLSACQTQTGEVSGGDEVVALNRAFLYAGTPTVIASLWNVDDKATGLFMERFYIHLRAGKGKADALRQAQLDLRADETYGHPYYWAGFTLVGDME